MLMTPSKLIVLRLFNVTLGRALFFNKLLRRLLVYMFIHSRQQKEQYMASSHFFVTSELD